MKPPEQIIAALRSDVNPAHGIWELHRRYSDAFALLLEQNEEIIMQLKNLNEPVTKDR